MSHGHHCKHQPLLYVAWCSNVIRSSQNVCGSALPFAGCCAHLIDGFYCCLLCWWRHLGQLGYLGLFHPCTTWPPGCTFTTAFAVLSLVHTMMPNVFLYNMGSSLCLGWSALANPAPSSCSPNLLAFWVFCSSPPALRWEPPGPNRKFSWGGQEPQCHVVSGRLCCWGGMHGLSSRCFREPPSLLLLPPRVRPGFTDVSEGGCHRRFRSLITN